MIGNSNVLYEPFDIETHKKTFINYLEVVIHEDGLIEYAIPSHQRKLIAIACDKLSVNEEELNAMCPPEYYFDFMTWLCSITKTVSVWNGFYNGGLNLVQKKQLLLLKEEGLYSGNI